MSLKTQTIVNGVYNMMRYYSIGIKLNDVIKDKDTEQIVLENIRRCSKIVGKYFKVVFWHEGLSEKECKDFVKRNEKLLFEVNTKITKVQEPVWFLIGQGVGSRYHSEGDILEGIVNYLGIVNHIKKRDKE